MEYENIIYPEDAKYCLCCGIPLLGSHEHWHYQIIKGAKICDECLLRKNKNARNPKKE